MNREEFIKKAIAERLKKCGECKKWVTFLVELSETERTKQCPNCKATRAFPLSRAVFQNGKRLEADGLYHDVAMVKVKGGHQILPV